jgi:hypothetical protein
MGVVSPLYLRFLEWSFLMFFTVTPDQFLSFYVQPQSIPFILSLIYFSFSFGISAFGSCKYRKNPSNTTKFVVFDRFFLYLFCSHNGMASLKFGSCVLFSLSLFICSTSLCSLLFHYREENTSLDFGKKLRNQKNVWIFISVLSLYLACENLSIHLLTMKFTFIISSILWFTFRNFPSYVVSTLNHIL